MKNFAVVAACLVLSQGLAFGQGVLYSPPGIDLSYGLGYDVGNGVQIGYGYGAGILLSPDQLMSTAQGPYLQPLNFEETTVLRPQPDFGWVQPVKFPAKKVKVKLPVKKVIQH